VNKLKLYAIIFISFTFSSALFAETQMINWDIIIKQAQEQNPSILEAKLEFENADFAYKRAIGQLFPEIGLSASLSHSGADSGIYSKNFSYGFSANLNLFDGFNRHSVIKQRSAELESAKAKYKRTVSDIAFNLANAYINLMWAYETVSLLERIKDRRSENREMIQLKYNFGTVDLGSLKRVGADVEIAQLDLRKAQRYIETASAALLVVLGLELSDTILTTQERLPMTGRNIRKPEFSKLIVNIPEYIIARYSVEIYEAQLKKANSVWYPSLNASAGLSRSNNQFQPSSDNMSWNAALSLSYALFKGGADYYDAKSADNNFKIAQSNFKSIKNGLFSKAVSNFNDLLDAYESISVRSSYLAAAQTQAEISERKYVNGLSSYQDWYSIENDYISSQRQLLEVRRTAAAAEAQWRNFIGNGFFKIVQSE
jgi:outer membrane protein TolC